MAPSERARPRGGARPENRDANAVQTDQVYAERNRFPRQFRRDEWAAAVSRLHPGTAGRLIANQLLDRCDGHGRVRLRPANLAACTALPITTVQDTLADFSSRGLLGRDDRGHLVLVLPGRWSR